MVCVHFKQHAVMLGLFRLLHNRGCSAISDIPWSTNTHKNQLNSPIARVIRAPPQRELVLNSIPPPERPHCSTWRLFYFFHLPLATTKSVLPYLALTKGASIFPYTTSCLGSSPHRCQSGIGHCTFAPAPALSLQPGPPVASSCSSLVALGFFPVFASFFNVLCQPYMSQPTY